jgi:SAM-dependent methyltransferase
VLRDRDATILDFGGGKGRLLYSFVEAGFRCGVLDYVDSVIPGVDYLGRELADLPADARFHMIICSHVIEHLAEPKLAIEALRDRLEDNGRLYIEVPLEIWKRAPPSMDPVTHINFFTRESLRTLMEASGLTVLHCGYQSFTRPNGKTGIAIKAVGEILVDRSESTPTYAGMAPVKRLLKPRFIDRLMRVVAHPRLLSNYWK